MSIKRMRCYRIRIRINVNGRVQGVGFRPTVYRYAKGRNLCGWVSNTSQGVIIEVEGDEENVDDFLKSLKSSPPPQAEISHLTTSSLSLQNDVRFKILPSVTQSQVKTQISPDIATCKDCLKELFEPSDRRYLYPFLNCTNCGPRFTIVKNIPYDRDKTTMEKFVMCSPCREEYENPLKRRFHAQPNACPECGPEVTLVQGLRFRVQGSGVEAIKKAIRLLKEGRIVAIKGLGGFHLACDATNDEAVGNLRMRKYREDKPFALMAKDLETIRQYCEVSPSEEKLLHTFRRPIVLLKKVQGSGSRVQGSEKISKIVAPNNEYLGFMLPYTPLHYLLFSQLSTLNSQLSVLVMTSGNVSDEPVSYENEEAISRLSHIADYFLLHNRDIYTRCDDSVTRIFERQEMIIRRSRGYVPSPLRVPFIFEKEILACGAHLKNTFALAKGDEVFVSHHIGDLENLETLQAFEKGIEHFKKLFDIEPVIIAHDLHPEYLSTKYAKKLSTLNSKLLTIPIQHHHAHIISCLADNEVDNHKVIGVAFDGTGYGEDGNIWGGEFLLADFAGFTRKAYLKYIPLPGGEQAIKEPWRIAATYLYEAYGGEFGELGIDFTWRLDKSKWAVLEKMIHQRLNCPLTSSMGRLFDAVSSLVGIRDRINYEGQAAVELEMQMVPSPQSPVRSYEFKVEEVEDILVIEPLPTIRGVVKDLQKKLPVSFISEKFHNTVAGMVVEVCKRIRKEVGLGEVALSGGVFQNMFLLNRAFDELRDEGFKVYIHSRVPTNDGGISLGQAVIANAKFKG